MQGLRPIEAAASQRAISAAAALVASSKRIAESLSAQRPGSAEAKPAPKRKPLVKNMSTTIGRDLMAELHDGDEADDDGAMQAKFHPGSLDQTDGSSSGPLAARVHRCEGALDAIAGLEVAAAPWMEAAGVAAMVSLTQNRTMMAMKEARAAASLADIAKEKLDDLDGRLDGGLQLHVALESAHPGETPRPIVRGMLAHISHQLGEAEAQLEAGKQDLAIAEESHARLQQCLGRVSFLRSVASRLAIAGRVIRTPLSTAV